MPFENFVSESIYLQSNMKINALKPNEMFQLFVFHILQSNNHWTQTMEFHLLIKARHTTGSSCCSISSADISSPDAAGTEDAGSAAGTEDAGSAAGTEDEAAAAGTEDEAAAAGAEDEAAASGPNQASGAAPPAFLRHDLTWQATHCRTATTSNTSWRSHFMFISNKTFLA